MYPVGKATFELEHFLIILGLHLGVEEADEHGDIVSEVDYENFTDSGRRDD